MLTGGLVVVEKTKPPVSMHTFREDRDAARSHVWCLRSLRGDTRPGQMSAVFLRSALPGIIDISTVSSQVRRNLFRNTPTASLIEQC